MSRGRSRQHGRRSRLDRPPSLLHEAVVEAHELCLVVILEDKLARTLLGFAAKNDLGAEMALELLERLANVGINVRFGGCAARQAARSAGPSVRRVLRAAHTACGAASQARPAKRGHVRPRASLPQSSPGSWAPASAGGSRWPPWRGPCRFVRPRLP